ncbi:unnamed protein product, partial [Oppiella nova]
NYPLDGTDPSAVIPVATTRLETIVGDVAIAVHPEDSRYQHVVGRHAVHPFTGRRMPIVADRSVRPELGTGAVKITPAHSVFDYALAERHSLPALDVFDSEGRLHCPDAPEFTGLHRFEAKDVVRRALESRGLYVSCEPHRQSIPVCHRSGDLIESRLLSQWFLKCDKQRVLAQFVVNRDEMSAPDERQWRELSETVAPEDRHLSIVPPNYRNVWKDWFSRWEDWCISRQIYWGHRIPAYNVIIDGMPTDDWIAAKSDTEALAIARNNYPSREVMVRQDPDVLDTWFSSALLPLTVNGWPERDLRDTTDPYFPLSLMETGHDIIFFWVSRMVVLSLALTDRLPFRRVLLHGMVCDGNGKKMSKTRGNAIDPLDMIDGISLADLKAKTRRHLESGLLSNKELDVALRQLSGKFPKGVVSCGADALRYSLLELEFKAENVAFDGYRVFKNRNFCNKMYQTVRYLAQHVDSGFTVDRDVLAVSVIDSHYEVPHLI